MEDGGDSRTTARSSIDTSTSNKAFTGRDRSTSAPSTSASTSIGHRRSLSSSFFSRLSFLRMNQPTHVSPPLNSDGDDLPSTLSSGRAMSSALQQQRRTRRRRGSLRKTALLGTRLEKKARAVASGQRMSLVAQENEPTPRGSYDGRCGGDDGSEWPIMTAQKQPLEPRPTSCIARENLLDRVDVITDDDDEISFSPFNSTTTTNTTNNNNSSNESTDPPIHTSSTDSTANL
ncbi:hypothetical protein PHISCL_08826, partial [Aspergillus sclerotialis]